MPIVIPKQFLNFEKVQSKSKKEPLFHQKFEKLKKILKPQGVGEFIISLSLTPPNIPIVNPTIVNILPPNFVCACICHMNMVTSSNFLTPL